MMLSMIQIGVDFQDDHYDDDGHEDGDDDDIDVDEDGGATLMQS